MALLDLVARVVARPAGRVIEVPVRDIVQEALKQGEFVNGSEIRSLRRELDGNKATMADLEQRLSTLANAVEQLQQETQEARAQARDAHDALKRAEEKLAIAQAQAQAALRKAEAPKAEAPKKAPKAEAPQKAPKAEAPKKAPKAEAPKADKARGRKSLEHLGCKVADCDGKHRSKGFCSRHYQAWRRGRLEGFVGPEGLFEHKGQPLQVDASLQGEAVKVTGKGDKLKVKVGKSEVAFQAVS